MSLHSLVSLNLHLCLRVWHHLRAWHDWIQFKNQVCQLSLTFQTLESVPDMSTVCCRLQTLSIPQRMWRWQYLGTATIVSNVFLCLSLGWNFYFCCPQNKSSFRFIDHTMCILVSRQLHAALLTVMIVSTLVWCSLSILFMGIFWKLNLKNHKIKWVLQYLLFHQLTTVIANDSDFIDCQ